MRNTIMYIRNISDNTISNFDMAVDDNGTNEGIKTIINDFWDNENEILKQKTFIKLAELEIINIFKEVVENKDSYYLMKLI